MTGATKHDLSNIVTFTTSHPAGDAIARVELGGCIDAVPTWSIDTLNAGPPRSSPRYGRHVQNTVGSSYDWSDELRFDKRTGRLASFVLKTPESGTLDPVVARSWLALPRQAGLPILTDHEQGFHIDPLDLRYLSEDASGLVVGDVKMQISDSSSLRLSIGKDTDFLFHRGRYTGWILGSPLAHLVSDPDDAAPGSDEPRLHALLHDYLTLVVEPNISRMSDEDPTLKTALQQLHSRLEKIEALQARTLESIVMRVLEVFYSGQQ